MYIAGFYSHKEWLFAEKVNVTGDDQITQLTSSRNTNAYVSSHPRSLYVVCTVINNVKVNMKL